MKAIVKDVEIRGHEVKHSAKTDKDYIVVRFEDDTGMSQELVDRDMEREPYYTRGVRGDLYIDIRTGKFTSIEIKDFKKS